MIWRWGAALAFVLVAGSAGAESSVEDRTQKEKVEDRGAIAFLPAAGIVAPLGGSSAIERQLAVGGSFGARLGWRFGAVPLSLTGGLDYTRHASNDLEAFFPDVDQRYRRGSGSSMLDATLDVRYWWKGLVFAGATLGYTGTSVVRIRNIMPSSGLASRDPRALHDIPPDGGLLTGLGAGVALLRLSPGDRSPDAAMLTLGVDLRLRVLSSGTLVTLPVTIGLNL